MSEAAKHTHAPSLIISKEIIPLSKEGPGNPELGPGIDLLNGLEILRKNLGCASLKREAWES